LAPQPASASRSACELFREAIEVGLAKGRNAKAIWQDLVDRSGFAGGYQSVKRFLRNLRGKSSPEACAVIETAPGEHEKAFRRLGGATRVVMIDNLREGVLKPDVYDPTLNPLYRDVLAHYGSVALACRVRDPDRKGKVESGVG